MSAKGHRRKFALQEAISTFPLKADARDATEPAITSPVGGESAYSIRSGHTRHLVTCRFAGGHSISCTKSNDIVSRNRTMKALKR
jgi:hypothetical protein